MSWQEYVDSNLMCPVDADGNTLQSAALVGLDGGVWAQSPEFPALTQAEALAMAGILNDPDSNPGSFTIGGTKYMVLMSEDPESKLRGKCQGGGCSVNKTVTCLVVGIWKEPVPASACNRVVEALGEYLKDNNY
mmetsp:Transcript_10793/g.32084  ORF Transcript_10793/g.32084 Transcript_10793/m.32084 type:complete len:134 (+) Transcript_10793:110-511(+)